MDRLECCDTEVYAGTNESILICYCFVCYPKENEVSWIENEQRGRAEESDKSRARVARNHDNYAESNRACKDLRTYSVQLQAQSHAHHAH